MKILFLGNGKRNSGPGNVNKSMIKCLSNDFYYVKSSNKYLSIIETIWKYLLCRVIVVSGVSKWGAKLLTISSIFNKRTVYIMHGCNEYETKINEDNIDELQIKFEKIILEKADLLLPVSKKFMNWVKSRYPQYAHKTSYLFNGMEMIENKFDINKKKKGYVIAAGGDRVVKNNLVLCRAIEQMNGAAKLEVYGRIHNAIPEESFEHAQYMGVIPQTDFLDKMTQAELYVLNSIYEPFCLAVMEALSCGCSVLVSNVAGVTDLLDLEDNDIIFNPMDEEEIKQKIQYLLEYPNNKRILSKINFEDVSYENSVKRLKELCIKLESVKK